MQLLFDIGPVLLVLNKGPLKILKKKMRLLDNYKH